MHDNVCTFSIIESALHMQVAHGTNQPVNTCICCRHSGSTQRYNRYWKPRLHGCAKSPRHSPSDRFKKVKPPKKRQDEGHRYSPFRKVAWSPPRFTTGEGFQPQRHKCSTSADIIPGVISAANDAGQTFSIEQYGTIQYNNTAAGFWNSFERVV